MARPKKTKERADKPTHLEIHEGIRICSREMYDKTCNDEEENHALLVAINGWLNHIDECLSELTDRDAERERRYKSIDHLTIGKKGGKANDESASRADDAREV